MGTHISDTGYLTFTTDNTPRYYQNDSRSDGRSQIGIDILYANLGKDCRQSRKESRQQSIIFLHFFTLLFHSISSNSSK